MCGDGLLVVDTRSGGGEADELRADLRTLSPLPVRWVVNTHGHYDHCFGNQRFGPASDLAVPIYGHERVPDQLRTYEEPELAERIAGGVEPVDEWRGVVITPPTELVGRFRALRLSGATGAVALQFPPHGSTTAGPWERSGLRSDKRVVGYFEFQVGTHLRGVPVRHTKAAHAGARPGGPPLPSVAHYRAVALGTETKRFVRLVVTAP